MNLKRFLRVLLFVGPLVYLYHHISNTCPLSQSLPNDLNDITCKYTHEGYTFVSPYIGIANGYYESSPVKIYVEKTQEKISSFFNQHLVLIKETFYQKTNLSEEELLANLESGQKLLAHHLANAINFTYDQLTNKVIPALRISFQGIKLTFEQIKIWVKVYWQLYAKPFFALIHDKFIASTAGKYWLQFLQSGAFQTISNYWSDISLIFNNIYEYITSRYVQFKETNKAISMSESFKIFEDKKDFLLNEINKYFEPLTKEKDEELTSTSTITITSTSTKNKKSSPSTEVTVPTSEKYSQLLKSTLESAQTDFESQISKLSDEHALKLRAKIMEQMKELGNSVSADYDKLHQMRRNINKITNPSEEGFVSRQDYRDAISEKRSQFESIAQLIKNEIELMEVELSTGISKSRDSILETLEQFADSSLNAYSAEIVSNGDKWEEWKKFNEAKKEIINFRDELVKIKPVDWENHKNNAWKEVTFLVNEGGSYLALIRAQANVEFQQREAEEKAAKLEEESAKSETETQTETQTQTVLKIVPLKSAQGKVEIEIEGALESVEHAMEQINEHIQYAVDPINEAIKPVIEKAESIADDVATAAAFELAYEAAEVIEDAVEGAIGL